MVKTLTIVGARPQFIKAAPVLKLLDNDILVHTGQHFDSFMSQIFFDELDIKTPEYNLQTGSGTHIEQITIIMKKLESIIDNQKPDAIIVYGDTNSTLAGAFTAKQMGIRLVHVEAGLRSYNTDMIEEYNRVNTDRLADLLLCPTENSWLTLVKESLSVKATVVGDTMYDLIVKHIAKFDDSILSRLDITKKDYYLCTLHRPVNVDDIGKLKTIFTAFQFLGKSVILPCHPRTAKKLNYVFVPNNVKIIEPVSYMDMMRLAIHSKRIITDSGGLQKEAHMLGVPCITLRNETEWMESVDDKANILTKIDCDEIINNVNSDFNDIKFSNVYGDGNAAIKIVEAING